MPVHCVVTHHTSLLSGDDILRKFWELEERSKTDTVLSPEERSVLQHFKAVLTLADSVPLPKKSDAKSLGESRSHRFHSLERALHAKGLFGEFEAVIEEMGHVEPVPPADVNKPPQEVFYLPMHAHRNPVPQQRSELYLTPQPRLQLESHSTTCCWLDPLCILHSLIWFCLYRVALTTDVSRMYRGIELVPSDHRFVWRRSMTEPLSDFHMTRVTFGVSASSFATNKMHWTLP